MNNESPNNLIKDYCVNNKVVIEFNTHDQFAMINGLFDEAVNSYPYIHAGLVSFFVVSDTLGRTTRRFTTFKESSTYKDYIRLTADEFFILALPSKSILEYIK